MKILSLLTITFEPLALVPTIYCSTFVILLKLKLNVYTLIILSSFVKVYRGKTTNGVTV